MAWLPIAMAAVQAIGTLSQSRAQADTARAQAQALDYNAAVARQNAQIATEQTVQREQTQRRQARAVMGRQAAALAQSGVGLSGSALDVADQSGLFAELDALNIRYEGALQSRGYLAQSSADEFQAGRYREQAKSHRTAGLLGAGASLLAGVGKWYSGSKRGGDPHSYNQIFTP